MKNLFIIKIQSQSDVITNSSSELFIFGDKNSKDEVIDLLNSVYPNWRDEYAEPVPFSEIDENDLYYLKFAREYSLEPEIFWEGFDDLKVEIKGEKWKYIHCPFLEISEKGEEALIKANPNTWLLYSLDENPNWDHQEDLMQIATRIHLG